MATATKSGRRGKPELIASQQFAQVFQAYMECSDEVQGAIRELVLIVNEPEADRDEVEAALSTIADALFPSCHDGMLGLELDGLDKFERESHGQAAALLDELDAQEAAFAERVAALLQEKQMTQGDLATALNIGQPAVSMMLSRNCRPQRRTVERIAEALGVNPSDLFPESGV